MKLLYTNLGEDVRKWSPAAVNRYGSLLPFLTSRFLEMVDGRIVIESPSALSSVKKKLHLCFIKGNAIMSCDCAVEGSK